MFVTWSELIQSGLLICAVISLVIEIMTRIDIKKAKKNKTGKKK